MRRKDPAKAQQQREHIMRAALKCFEKKGVQGTTTDDICRAAKVSSGTLYYYFKSRDGLLHDLVVHAHATRDQLVHAIKDEPDLVGAVIAAQYASKRAIEDQGMPINVFLELLVQAQRNKALKTAFEDAAARVHAIICEAVRAHQAAGRLPADLPAESLAIFLAVVASGTSIVELIHRDLSPESYRDVVSAILHRALPGTAKPGTKRPKARSPDTPPAAFPAADSSGNKAAPRRSPA